MLSDYGVFSCRASAALGQRRRAAVGVQPRDERAGLGGAGDLVVGADEDQGGNTDAAELGADVVALRPGRFGDAVGDNVDQARVDALDLDRAPVMSAVSNARWIAFAQAAKVAIQFASVAILARLLSPDDYGLIAILGVLLSILLPVVMRAREAARRVVCSWPGPTPRNRRRPPANSSTSCSYWYTLTIPARESCQRAGIATPVVTQVTVLEGCYTVR